MSIPEDEGATTMSITTHPLHDLIMALSNELRQATNDYATTGGDLIDTQILSDDTQRRSTTREDVLRAHHAAAIGAESNETKRRLVAAQLLNDDAMLCGLRADAARLQESHRRAEVAHKNAYHEMETLRVRLAALTALVQGMA